jgi:hypothetical protein
MGIILGGVWPVEHDQELVEERQNFFAGWLSGTIDLR